MKSPSFNAKMMVILFWRKSGGTNRFRKVVMASVFTMLGTGSHIHLGFDTIMPDPGM